MDASTNSIYNDVNEELSELILDNANLALIIKPQFSFNSSERCGAKGFNIIRNLFNTSEL